MHGIRLAEIASRAGLDASTLTNLLNQKRHAGPVALEGLLHALEPTPLQARWLGAWVIRQTDPDPTLAALARKVQRELAPKMRAEPEQQRLAWAPSWAREPGQPNLYQHHWSRFCLFELLACPHPPLAPRAQAAALNLNLTPAMHQAAPESLVAEGHLARAEDGRLRPTNEVVRFRLPSDHVLGVNFHRDMAQHVRYLRNLHPEHATHHFGVLRVPASAVDRVARRLLEGFGALIALAEAPAGRVIAGRPIDPALPPCDRVVALHLHLSPAGWVLDPADATAPPVPADPRSAPPASTREPLPVAPNDPLWDLWRPQDVLQRLLDLRCRRTPLSWLAAQLGLRTAALQARLRGDLPFSDEDLDRICAHLDLHPLLASMFKLLVACWQRPTASLRLAALDALIGLHEGVAAHLGQALPLRLDAQVQSRAVALLAHRPPAEIAATLGLPTEDVTAILRDLRVRPLPDAPLHWLPRATPGLAPRLAEEGLLQHQGLLLAQRPGVLYLHSEVWAIPAARLDALRLGADALRAEVDEIVAACQDDPGRPNALYTWFGVGDLSTGQDVRAVA